ncbi:MAG: SDR family oxidoreductase [Cyclobacteriaceae bacterium]|nr:SDR family oxidoreductase [Cyclobacteriaceae bacterium]
MNIDLTGKQAVVCGSTRGIGKACAIELASLGADITLIARDERKLLETLGSLDTSKGQFHDYLVIDFSEPDELFNIISDYASAKSKLHILVNNTGGPAPGNITEAKPDELLKAFQQHLICAQHLVSQLYPLMKNCGYGRIINIVSTSVKVPIPGLGVSNTIRAAMAGWSKTLAGELAPFGITVNNILPGLTRTDRLNQIISTRAEKYELSTDELEQMMMEGIPAQRFAESWEIAALAGFLASESAAYITGESIRVDGGNTPSI